MTIVKLGKAKKGRDAFTVAEATCFPSSCEEFATVRRQGTRREHEEEGEVHRFSLPSTTHPRPHQSAPLRCIAAGDAAKCDAMQRLFSAAHCERSSGDAASLPEGGERRSSQVGHRVKE